MPARFESGSGSAPATAHADTRRKREAVRIALFIGVSTKRAPAELQRRTKARGVSDELFHDG